MSLLQFYILRYAFEIFPLHPFVNLHGFLDAQVCTESAILTFKLWPSHRIWVPWNAHYKKMINVSCQVTLQQI